MDTHKRNGLPIAIFRRNICSWPKGSPSAITKINWYTIILSAQFLQYLTNSTQFFRFFESPDQMTIPLSCFSSLPNPVAKSLIAASHLALSDV